MNTVADIKEFLELFNDEDVIVFAVTHRKDEQYFDRSVENKQASILAHPLFYFKAVAAGTSGNQKTQVNTIFLTND